MATNIDIDPGFEGFPPLWYYLDRPNHKLQQDLPKSSVLVTSDKATLSFWPRFLNAPGKALGSNAKTQFSGNDKPNAYLKAQVTQDRIGAGATSPLTWSAIYPVLDGPHDDIGNKFFSDPVSGDPIDHIPLPGGTAKLTTPLTAIVGGQRQSKFVDILDKVLGIAGSAAGKAVFPIPAADIALAGNVETLVNLATSAFAPDTKQQFWINDTTTPVRLTASTDPNDDSLVLPKGTSFLVAFQDVTGRAVSNAVTQILATTSIDIDRGGALIGTDGTGATTDPFANFVYVTYRVVVAEA